MAKTKTPNIVTQIVDRLYSDGPLTVSQMCETIKYPYKSVYTKALELQKLNLADKDDEGVWSLREGVTPRTLETGELVETGAAQTGEGGAATEPKVPPIARGAGAPLDQRTMFIQQLTATGVSPREAIPTIADIFFSGDIEDLAYLNWVLQSQAQGYVSTNQRRLMMTWWAKTRGLPYTEEGLGLEAEGDGKGRKTGAKPEKRMDPGIGWKIEKDRDGEWVAEAGGPMSYQEAIEAAKERQVISAYARTRPEPKAEGEETGEGEATGLKRGGKQEPFMEKMFFKLFDNLMEGKKGKEDGESSTVQRLMERIETMEREKDQDRMERLEGAVAQALARDPWEEYDKIEEMKKRLGGGGQVVTDQSPAVQLIKDSTERVDKNINRLVGIMERTALKGEEFAPETTRTPGQREDKAGELLNTVTGRDHSRGLRRDTFGF